MLAGFKKGPKNALIVPESFSLKSPGFFGH